MSTTLTGHCYCGGIRFEVTMPARGEAIFALYCHCDSCRRAHAAPLYQVATIDASWFRITEGAELLTEFQRPEASVVRAFCSSCGSKILNRFPGWRPDGRTPLAFFPDTLEEEQRRSLPAALLPTGHANAGECVLDFTLLDALPR
ncbi:MAG: GFA family protein [Myxococcota bacterium]